MPTIQPAEDTNTVYEASQIWNANDRVLTGNMLRLDETATAASIQAGAEALHVAGGGTLQLPAGTVLSLTGTIRLTGLAHVVIRGHGSSTILRSASSNFVKILIDNCDDITIRDLHIDGTALISAGSEADHIGIRGQNSTHLKLLNLTGQWLTQGIELRVFDQATGSTLTHGLSTLPTVFGVHHSLIQGCTFTDTKDVGITLFRDCSHNRILGNHCMRSGSHGILLDDGTVHDEGRISADHPTGFAQAPSFNTIAGNVCTDNTVTGICLSGAQHTTVTGNVCDLNGVYKDPNDDTESTGYAGVIRAGYGIEMLNVQDHVPCRYNTITGNSCSNNRRTGITLLGAEYNVIANNVCTDDGNDYGGTPASAGIWLLESASYSCLAVTRTFSTTLSANAALNATTLNVAGVSGALVNMGIYVTMSDGKVHPCFITAVGGSSLTISPGLANTALSGASVAAPAAFGAALSANAGSTAATLTCFGIDGAAVGMAVSVVLSTGALHATVITGLDTAAKTLTISPVLPGVTALAGAAVGQLVIGLDGSPTTVAASGPEFTASSSVGYNVQKRRITNPGENDWEYNTLAAVDEALTTVTLAAPPTHPIRNGLLVWKPYGSSYNLITGNKITRTQVFRMLRGIALQDKFSIGNRVIENDIIDLTANADNAFTNVFDGASVAAGASIPTYFRGNTRGLGAHQGTVTLTGTTPVVIATPALRSGGKVEVFRVAGNTGKLSVSSVTLQVDAAWSQSILDADASLGATSIVVLNATGFAAGRTVRIALDASALTWHTTTVGGAYAGGTTIPLVAALPSGVTNGWAAQALVPATAGSFSLVSDSAGDTGQVIWSVSL